MQGNLERNSKERGAVPTVANNKLSATVVLEVPTGMKNLKGLAHRISTS
jgi:hypothetical protein